MTFAKDTSLQQNQFVKLRKGLFAIASRQTSSVLSFETCAAEQIAENVAAPSEIGKPKCAAKATIAL
jgi:hypothetical protein